MPQPRVLVLRAPGTNCDGETAHAFRLAGAEVENWHALRLFEQPGELERFQILCIPGGFSYGDDLAAGRIFGNQLRTRLDESLRDFPRRDRLVLGICNGFQVIARSGLLWPDAAADEPPATLAWNDSTHFEDRWIHMRADGDKSVFLRGIARLFLPVAHAEGKFVARDQATLERLDANRQLVLRYVPENAEAPGTPAGYPDNPNGSQADVAGMCDETGRVLGLMPHPERFVDATQHPYWTRLPELPERGDGFRIFRNAVEYFL
jgi:phosphoribosylformylglycinamidine synthase I